MNRTFACAKRLSLSQLSPPHTAAPCLCRVVMYEPSGDHMRKVSVQFFLLYTCRGADQVAWVLGGSRCVLATLLRAVLVHATHVQGCAKMPRETLPQYRLLVNLSFLTCTRPLARHCCTPFLKPSLGLTCSCSRSGV